MSTENQSLAVAPANNMNVGMVVAGATDRLAAIDRVAAWFAKSGLFGCDRVEQGAVLALTCMTEGMSPLEFSRTYDIVDGKIRKKAMAAFAEFRRRGGRVKWTKSGDDGQEAAAEFTFEGQTVALSFTIDTAKAAGLVRQGSGWVKNPGNMLRARLVSNALGMLAPEIYAGEFDDDGDPPAPTINLGPTPAAATAPAPAPAKARNVTPARETPAATAPPPEPAAAKTVEVEVVTTPPAAPAPAPAVTPAPAPAVETLPDHVQAKLLEVITPERIPDAVKFLVKVNWLRVGQSIDELPLDRAQQILTKPDAFLAKIGGGK